MEALSEKRMRAGVLLFAKAPKRKGKHRRIAPPRRIRRLASAGGTEKEQKTRKTTEKEKKEHGFL